MTRYSSFDYVLTLLVVILIVINWLVKFVPNAIAVTVLSFLLAYIDLIKYLVSEKKKLVKIILVIIMTICGLYYIFENKIVAIRTGGMSRIELFIYLVVGLMTPCLWVYLILKVFLLIYYGVMKKIKGNDNNE